MGQVTVFGCVVGLGGGLGSVDWALACGRRIGVGMIGFLRVARRLTGALGTPGFGGGSGAAEICDIVEA